MCEVMEEELEEVELSLGLSTNGRFGVDLPPPPNKKLKRTSSIPHLFFNHDDDEGLGRAYSLPPPPTVTQEENDGAPPPPPPCLSKAYTVELEGIASQSHCQLTRQGSNLVDTRSPINAIANKLQNGKEKLPVTSGISVAKNSSNVAADTTRNPKDKGRNVLEAMPCVSTKGKGPNGKRIQGFLYQYRKGEEVRILCVCHGSFLTPGEFVKHAGGGDVAHPLRHIVVSPRFL